MDISLNQKEIEKSLIDYVEAQGVDTTNKDITVIFTPGRRQNTHSAVVSITPKKVSEEIPSEPIPRKEQEGPLFGDSDFGNDNYVNQTS